MSSDLEKFIQRNRRDFDESKPSEQVWERIRNRFPEKRKNSPRFRAAHWAVAAAILALLLSSAYFFFVKKYSQEKSGFLTSSEELPVETGSITPEYAVEFDRLNQSVSLRQKELEKAAVTQPELYQQFQQDLAVLDSSYRLLMTQVTQSVNQDVIIQAMIQNLQLQAQLLNRQLNIINQFKNSKNQKSHETNI